MRLLLEGIFDLLAYFLLGLFIIESKLILEIGFCNRRQLNSREMRHREAAQSNMTHQRLSVYTQRLLQLYIIPLLDQKYYLLKQANLSEIIDFLNNLTRGERLLNRSWSAASDGYLIAAWSHHAEALYSFEQASHDWQHMPY